jgi:membrane protein
VDKFFADRCTHLAAMVAYYALLSLMPLLFLALAVTGWLGRPEEGSTLIRDLSRVVPGESLDSLVRVVRSLQRNATELGIIGAVGLLWGALGFLSALESALNMIYGVPNRPFVRQKVTVFILVGAGLVAVLASLIVSATAHAFLARHLSPGASLGPWRVVLTVLTSTVVTFGFLFVVYKVVPNTELTSREVLPGAICATVLFQASFEVLPLYLRYAGTDPVLKTFGGAVLLLVWFYVMGNILLLGAEINWWLSHGQEREETAAGLTEEEALGHA